MAFSLKTFFEDLLEIAPGLVTGVLTLKNETGSVSKTQLATDSLSLATGISTALTSQDPDEQADAQAASDIVGQVIQSVAASGNVSHGSVATAAAAAVQAAKAPAA